MRKKISRGTLAAVAALFLVLLVLSLRAGGSISEIGIPGVVSFRLSKDVRSLREFRGDIDQSIPIRMFIRAESGRVSGFYYYVEHRRNIDLTGTINARGEVTMSGFFDGAQVDRFEGVLRDGQFAGTWSDPGRPRSLPFSVTEFGR